MENAILIINPSGFIADIVRKLKSELAQEDHFKLIGIEPACKILDITRPTLAQYVDAGILQEFKKSNGNTSIRKLYILDDLKLLSKIDKHKRLK